MDIRSLVEKAGGKIISTEPGTLLLDAVKMMNKNRVGALVVKDASGALKGIVSERDVLRVVDTKNGTITGVKVEEVMTPAEKIISIRIDTGLQETMEKMRKHKIRHIVVFDEDDNLVGFLSIRDIMDALLHFVSQQHDALQNLMYGY